jgi:hypothetical protein
VPTLPIKGRVGTEGVDVRTLNHPQSGNACRQCRDAAPNDGRWPPVDGWICCASPVKFQRAADESVGVVTERPQQPKVVRVA